MKKIFLIIISFLTLIANAQPPTGFYGKFGGDGEDVGYSIKTTLDRQYIITGSTSSYGNGHTDVYLVKVDSMGQIIWHKTFGGISNDIGKSVIQLADSGYVIAGFTNSFGAGGYDAYIIKTDKNGNFIWQNTFGGLDWDFANDLVVGSDNHIYVAGYTTSFGAGAKDGFVIKYDVSGTLIWKKYYGGAQNEELRSIIKTNDNFLATVGYTESRGEINGDGYFLKLDLNGDTLFTRTFGGGGKDYANDVIQKSYGKYMMAGAKTYSSSPYTQSLMYCISVVGDSLWERNLLKTNEDECFQSVANSMLIDGLTAFTRSVKFPVIQRQGELFVAEDNDGFENQINASGGNDEEFLYSIENTRDKGYIAVGSTTSFDSHGKDVYLVKWDSTALNYISIVGIEKKQPELKPTILYSEDLITVKFEKLNGSTIEIVDMTGRKMVGYNVEDKEFEINTSNFPTGIYVMKIKLKSGEIYNSKFFK